MLEVARSKKPALDSKREPHKGSSRTYSQVYRLAIYKFSDGIPTKLVFPLCERPQHGKLRNNLLSYSRYR